ncbi:MAG: DUF6498-containing protein [Halioglobus sp.]
MDQPQATGVLSEAGLPAGDYSGRRCELSLLVLVLVNLLPVLGVLLFGWDVGALVILYWSENLVLGFYTLVKMLLVAPLRGLGSGMFFSIHYGGFCAVHGLFIVILLIGQEFDPLADEPWPLFLVFIQLLLGVVREVLAQAPPEWLWAFGALVVSHGVSFVANFLLAGERRRVSLRQLMSAPYGRIVVLHVAILLGGFAVLAMGQPVILLLVLVLLKTALDVRLHVREHRAIARA